MSLRLRLGIGLTLILGLFYQLVFADAVIDPRTVIEPSEFNREAGIDYQPDSPMVTFRRGGAQHWLIALWDKTRGGIAHMRTQGSVDHPLAQMEWIKNQSSMFSYDHRKFDGNYWIVNGYQAEDGILAFVHVENAEGSGREKVSGKHLNGGKSRIGLAWSINGGDTFTYLGNIIIPYGDPEPFNIQGAPYLILGGYFYLYFHDIGGLTVARAPVAKVLSAARRGTTSQWMKYDGPQVGFASDGLGGPSKHIGIDGISHTDAACSTYTHKCYLLLSRMNWGGQASWLKLFESVDGVNWAFRDTIAQEQLGPGIRGYQYCTIIDEDGKDNSIVGQRFFVYCNKDHPEPSRKGLRWKVDLACGPNRSPC